MDKILKVCRFFQGKKHTNKINIAGDWLEKFGFETGDFVKVEVEQNKITIFKDEKTAVLTAMNVKNPVLYDMIEKLDLTA